MSTLEKPVQDESVVEIELVKLLLNLKIGEKQRSTSQVQRSTFFLLLKISRFPNEANDNLQSRKVQSVAVAARISEILASLKATQYGI
jgi:hypothetical protein